MEEPKIERGWTSNVEIRNCRCDLYVGAKVDADEERTVILYRLARPEDVEQAGFVHHKVLDDAMQRLGEAQEQAHLARAELDRQKLEPNAMGTLENVRRVARMLERQNILGTLRQWRNSSGCDIDSLIERIESRNA